MHSKRPGISTLILAAWSWALLALASPTALAVQHLIKPGDDWQHLGPRIRPGDEIILMPGRHRGASFERLIGTPQHPIIIRSVDPRHPCTIEAQREGIRVKSAAFLVIRDLAIQGGTISGISISGALAQPGQAKSESLGSGIVLQNLSISRVGPRGLRHACVLRSLENVQIQNCAVEGWGGSAIELIACRDVTIAKCQFKGLNDHGQINGIRARAGSQGVTIEECRFDNAGTHSIFIGGDSDAEEFDARLHQAAPSHAASVTEATNVRIQRCAILGSACTIAFQNAQETVIRNNTIIAPSQCIFAMLTVEKNPTPPPALSGAFGMNLVTWPPGELAKFAEVSPKIDASRFLIESNVWWSPESAEQRQSLGALPGKEVRPQTYDVNPKLDGRLKPSEPAALEFGFQ